MRGGGLKGAIAMGIIRNITEIVGNTPVVELSQLLGDPRASLFGKLEMLNPGGSVKDRAALGMVCAAEDEDLLRPGMTLVEPSSGNTGISLAMVAATRGYGMVVTMPETMTPERRTIMEYLGARVILTPGDSGMNGAISEAQSIAERDGHIMLSQFTNPANPAFHARTTAREIIADFGDTLDYFVAGVGTGGTFTGVGQVLRHESPRTKLVAVEPSASPVLSGGEAASHEIPGLGPGFISDIMDTSIIDHVIQIDAREAWDASRQIGRELGILAGISAGAAVAAGKKIVAARFSSEAERDFHRDPLRVLVVLPDTGERYLSAFVQDGH